MGKGREYTNYSIGYDPDAVEHDLQIISQLTRGMAYDMRKITMHQAQEIYYRIKNENIQFQSDNGEEFMLSLYEKMTDAQIQEINRVVRRKKQKKQSRRQLAKINRRIACIVSAVVLVSSLLCINWSILMDFRTTYQTKKLQKRVTDIEAVQSETIPDEKAEFQPSETASADGTVKMADQSHNKTENELTNGRIVELNNKINTGSKDKVLPKFLQLYAENTDFSGWLRIPGTKIDYPVMSREGDNNYYLDKNFGQQYDKNGSLILDYRSDIKNVDEPGHNFIIYGHNMRTGVMFGTLKNYKDKSFCDEHMTIQLDTLYEESEYKVVAAMLSGVAYEDEEVFRYYDAVDVSTEEDFNAFRENILSNAIYTTDETIDYEGTYLILSTCDNYIEDGRFVVIAKKM